MSRIFTVPNDMVVEGDLRPSSFTCPDNTLRDTHWDVGSPLLATKQYHQYLRAYAQKNGSAAVTERMPIHHAYAAGVLVFAQAVLTVANVGAATIGIVVYKNNVSVMASAWTLTTTPAAYVKSMGALAGGTVAYAADDVFEVGVTATAGGGTLGQGLLVTCGFRELPGS